MCHISVYEELLNLTVCNANNFMANFVPYHEMKLVRKVRTSEPKKKKKNGCIS